MAEPERKAIIPTLWFTTSKGPNKKREKTKGRRCWTSVCMSVCLYAASKPPNRQVFLPIFLHTASLNPGERLGQL